MMQKERIEYLIKYLLEEREEYKKIEIPNSIDDKKTLLRSLMNVRPPISAGKEFIKIQDEYLAEELIKKGIVDVKDLEEIQPSICLWQGDITTLKADAIVNAANSKMLGCFVPCHGCIDNAIHSAAGIQLRLECAKLMEKQGMDEPTGEAKITEAYNLPCRYVIHTVGPIVYDRLKDKHRSQLESCYRSCLELAESKGLKNIVFCCISTGEFKFPNDEAAEIAVRTVKEFLKSNVNIEKVIFNVFKDKDLEIYRKLLG